MTIRPLSPPAGGYPPGVNHCPPKPGGSHKTSAYEACPGHDGGRDPRWPVRAIAQVAVVARAGGAMTRVASSRDTETAPISSPNQTSTFALAFCLARRELRGGVRGLATVLLCLALGTGGVIAAVGSLRAAVDAGLAANGRQSLGGDVEIDGASSPLPDTLRHWLRDRGAAISDRVLMRSLLVAPSGDRTLIELKAVDGAWPLVGTAEASPPQPIATALAEQDGHYGLLADRLVLDRLGLKPGDMARVGTATFRVEGALTSEPDRVAIPAIFGPRVLISMQALPTTGLIAPGTMARYAIRATAPPAVAAALPGELRKTFADQGWRVREPRDAAPGVTEFPRSDELVSHPRRPDLVADGRHRSR